MLTLWLMCICRSFNFWRAGDMRLLSNWSLQILAALCKIAVRIEGVIFLA